MTSKRSPSFSELDPTQDDVHAEGSSGPGITVRRREANRLAAQRFRSRKKGYQDSLEERIKALEEERDGLLRRQGETAEGHGGPSADARVASLEAANRRLREEIRGVYEENGRLAGENERLHRELENWKRWREQVSDAENLAHPRVYLHTTSSSLQYVPRSNEPNPNPLPSHYPPFAFHPSVPVHSYRRSRPTRRLYPHLNSMSCE